MKQPSLYSYMVIFLAVFILYDAPQDIFTVRIITSVVITLITAVLLDGFIIWIKERRLRFPTSALISGLIIAGLIEPEAENIFIYFIPPAFAILSKHLIRVSNRNLFNPAVVGLLLTSLIFKTEVLWWAARPFFLVVPLGLFIVYRMRGWYIVLSFLIVNAIFLISFGYFNQITPLNSLSLINFFFVLFMLTEHKTTPLAKKGKIIYGCLMGMFSSLLFEYFPQVDNSLYASIAGNLCVPFLDRWARIKP